MVGEQRFASWNIVDGALMDGSSGHHHWEAKALTDELVRRGARVRLFTNQNVPAAQDFPGCEIIPVFSLSVWNSVSNDPTWQTLENFILLNRTFHREMSALDKSVFGQSLALFPTLQ